MKLIVSECKPSVYQTIQATSPLIVVAFRPHLYIHGSPAGTVRVELQDASGRTIKASADQTITSLKTSTYAHKYYRFDLSCELAESTSYRVAIVCAGGYSFSESAYVGVCHDWDQTKTATSYTPEDSFRKPLDIEIWERVP